MQGKSLLVYLAGKDETEQDGYCQLTVAKEDDVKQIWVGRLLKEEPKGMEREAEFRIGKEAKS